MIGLLLKNDLKRLFITPQAWILLAIGQLVVAWAYFSELQNYESLQHRLLALQSDLGVTSLVMVPSLLNALNIIMLITPLLSMRLIAAERQSQRFDLLLTSPATAAQILVAKYAQLMIMLGIFWLLALLQLLVLNFATSPDMGKLLLLWLMGWLVIATYSAVGIWISSLTRHPLIAAVATYGALLLLRIAGAVEADPGLLDWFSVTFHLADAQRGLLNSTDIAYFVLMTVLFLTLAWIRLLSFRSHQYIWAARFLLMAVLMLLVISWPLLNQFEFKYDMSDSRQNSLTPGTQGLLDRLDGPLSFTAYVDENSLSRKQLQRLLESFQMYKPDIVIGYVDPAAEPQIAGSLGITRSGEVLVRYQKNQQLVKRVREKDIAQTLRQMLKRDHGWILNLQGHDEINLSDKGRFGASMLTSSLRARGYKIRNYNLSELGSLPDNTDLVIVGGARNSLSETESLQLNRYLADGGNLLWLLEPEDKKAQMPSMLPKLALFPGVIVDAMAAQYKLASPANAIVSAYDKHMITGSVSQFSVFPGAGAFEVLEARGWQQVLSLETGPKSWNETGELRGELDRDALLFEEQGPLQLAAFWEKNALNDAKQKLAVIADSDFLRNHALGRGDNLALTLNMFFWLTEDSDQVINQQVAVPDQQIFMSSVLRAVYGGFFLFALPGMLLLSGIFFSWRARRN